MSLDNSVVMTGLIVAHLYAYSVRHLLLRVYTLHIFNELR
jgi:hypothetical protein